MTFGRTMERYPTLDFAHLSLILCQLHPQQNLINQVGELTSGRGTEKCSIIIFVFVMCQPHPPTCRQQIGELTLGRGTEKSPIIILQ